MKKYNAPIPQNESERLLHLASLDLDYTSLNDSLKDLNRLAAKVAGTDISQINLIDAYTQWTVGSHGLEAGQIDREESVCQYTIMDNQVFEVPDLLADERFNTKFFVEDPLSLRYYLGVPLRDNGVNIGALCVLDTTLKSLSPEKIELLKIIAEEIVNRIKFYHTLESMQERLNNADQTSKKVAHDIRGPLAGIIGLSEMISSQGSSANLSEVMDFIKMIHGASKSLLDLADEILSQSDRVPAMAETELSLSALKNKLIQLYLPQATNKHIDLNVFINEKNKDVIFSKNRVLQIIGNLISNAIKFTPNEGKIDIKLDMLVEPEKNLLDIIVTDSGVGIDQGRLEKILSGNAESTKGTSEEKGYGFGLPLVKHLIDKLGGSILVDSKPGQGTSFRVRLPQKPL